MSATDRAGQAEDFMTNNTDSTVDSNASRQATRERPIIFSSEMVRAILEGRKTQTRRIVKPEPSSVNGRPCFSNDGYECAKGNHVWTLPHCPYGVAGARLWVREAHAWADMMIDNVEREDAVCVAYKADKAILRHEDSPPLRLDTYGINFEHKSIKWRPSIHMPRWASRITLEITKVRVERLQDIDTRDAIAEGVCSGSASVMAIDLYRQLWDSLHKEHKWCYNPFVWVIDFKNLS